MGYLDAASQGGLLGQLPDNRLLGAADYAGVQPGYAPAGPTNAGPLYAAYRTFLDGAKAMPGQYLQQHQDFLNGIDPNTGQPAVTFASRMNTLGHYLATNAGPQSLGGAMAPVEGAFGAGPIRIPGFHGSPRTDLSLVSAMPEARQFDNATSQLGAFFAPEVSSAQRYAGKTGQIYQADLSLRNPYDMPYSEFDRFQSPHKGASGETLPSEQWGKRAEDLKAEAADLRVKLQQAGHDGVIVRRRDGSPLEIASFNDTPVTPYAGGGLLGGEQR